MPDVEEQLRRYASAAERAVPVTTRSPRRRAHRRWLAMATAAAMIAGAAWVALDDGDRSELSTDPAPPTSISTSTTHGETTTTGPATRTSRSAPVVAVTDTQYLVWSGEAGANDTSHRADGFAVDLETGAVRPIPVAPIDPRSSATGVWTGAELVVCCGTGQLDGFSMDTQTAAAWNPGSGAWRVLSPPPEAVARAFPASVWTGEEMVVVGFWGAAAYDPEEDSWREMAAPRLNGRRPEAAWTGDAMIVWDSTYGSGAVGIDEPADRGWIWSPGDDQWTPMPALPAGQRTRLGSMAWTGNEVVVWGQSTHDETLAVGARWRPDDPGRWTPIAPWPHNPVEDPYNGTPGSQTLAATEDGRVFVVGLGGSSELHTDLYDPAADRWLDLGFTISGFHPTVTIAGDVVLIPDEARPVAGRLPR